MPPVSKLQAKLDARHAKEKKRVAKSRKHSLGNVMQRKRALSKFYLQRGHLVPQLNSTNKHLFIKRKTIQTEEEIKKIVKDKII